MKVNRIIAGIMAVCVMGIAYPSVTSISDNNAITAEASVEYNYGSLEYVSYGSYIEITGCNKFVTEVVIPEEIDGIPVTSIGFLAFADNRKLKSIVIPDSITNIDNSAFWACTEMTSLTLSKNLTYIPADAFAHCGLTSVVIPEGVKTIGTNAFAYCFDLESVEIPDSVERIDEEAFFYTPWLDEKKKENPLVIAKNVVIDGKQCSGDVVIPDGIKSIASKAFSDNTELTSVVIPESVKDIGEHAFYNCKNLKSITELESVDRLGHEAFEQTPWFSEKKQFATYGGILIKSPRFGEITIPEGVKGISDRLFYKSGLSSVVLPSSLKSIGDTAFGYSYGLKSVTFSEGLEVIGNSAFSECENLESIEFPESLKVIGKHAFSASGLKSITFPEGLETIDEWAFYNMKAESVTIPENVETIGESAFICCSNLQKVTILNPECNIWKNSYVFTNEPLENVYKGTICGYENSTAQAYAEKYGRKFVSLGKAPEKETCSGDMNGDNKVNIADAVLLQSYILEKQELTEEQYKNADITGDGFVDSFDMVLMRRIIIENK
ncbi:MAG: leucine-rich repeat protein [Ruminococcus sp.]|nr:leucine-rich repeat protein [Ruminococcus sp.]